MHMIILKKIRADSKLFHRGEDGQAQVEFVLTILFVLLLIFGIIELIMFVYTYSVLADSAKVGVRYAIVHGANAIPASGPGNTGAISGPPGTGVVKTYAQFSFHSTTNMTVTVTYLDPQVGSVRPNDAPNRVRVVVSYPYQPLLGLGWPTVTVNAAAEGRIVF